MEDAPEAQAPISHSERIRDLSAIDTEVARLLDAAGHAVKALTGTAAQEANPNSPPAANDAPHDEASLDAAKQAFTAHNLTYLHTLQAISARLRRQAFALEEAGIISDDDAADAAAQTQPAAGAQGQRGGAPPMQITNGGLGAFDVGWLNSRRDDVGRAKEGELWRQARELLAETNGSGDSAE